MQEERTEHGDVEVAQDAEVAPELEVPVTGESEAILDDVQAGTSQQTITSGSRKRARATTQKKTTEEAQSKERQLTEVLSHFVAKSTKEGGGNHQFAVSTVDLLDLLAPEVLGKCRSDIMMVLNKYLEKPPELTYNELIAFHEHHKQAPVFNTPPPPQPYYNRYFDYWQGWDGPQGSRLTVSPQVTPVSQVPSTIAEEEQGEHLFSNI